MGERFTQHEGGFADAGKGCSAGEIDFGKGATVAEGVPANGGKCSGEGDVGEETAAHERLGREINQVFREAEVRAGYLSAERYTVRQATLHSCKQCRTQLAMRCRQTRRARCCKVREARSVELELLGNKHYQLIRERFDRARLLILQALGEA